MFKWSISSVLRGEVGGSVAELVIQLLLACSWKEPSLAGWLCPGEGGRLPLHRGPRSDDQIGVQARGSGLWKFFPVILRDKLSSNTLHRCGLSCTKMFQKSIGQKTKNKQKNPLFYKCTQDITIFRGCAWWSAVWLGTNSVYCSGTLSEQCPWFCDVRHLCLCLCFSRWSSSGPERWVSAPNHVTVIWTVSICGWPPWLRNVSCGQSHPYEWQH